MRVGCKVKRNQHRNLALRLFFNGLRSWEGIRGLKDTPENRRFLEAKALIISREMRERTFDYCRWFPDGNLAHLFKRLKAPAGIVTVETYFNGWIEKQGERVRPHRVKDYRSQFNLHILKTRIGLKIFGQITFAALCDDDLKDLQNKLKAKGLKASSVNGIVHSSLRAMLKSARGAGLLMVDLYDRAFFSPLPLTDSESSIDPFTPEERDNILEAFRMSPSARRRHFYPFVVFHFWQGPRPSESTALRRQDLDLKYGTARIHRSRVQGHEAGTKTKRSNREIRLHANVVEVLKVHEPLRIEPGDYVFTTPEGTPIDEQNFVNREWMPVLRAKNIRPRPFYNTRHSYASFLYSIGARSGFISSQTGDSIKTLEAHYAKYIEEADSNREFVEQQIERSATPGATPFSADHGGYLGEIKKPPAFRGLEGGAGEEGRTPDLMLGKHTL
jgi:integrase